MILVAGYWILDRFWRCLCLYAILIINILNQYKTGLLEYEGFSYFWRIKLRLRTVYGWESNPKKLKGFFKG